MVRTRLVFAKTVTYDDQYDYNTCDTLKSSQHDCETVGFMDAENVGTIDSKEDQSLSLSLALTAVIIDKTLSLSSTAILANDIEYYGCIENKRVRLLGKTKQFQLDCFNALKSGKYSIIVQPTGFGKSVHFTLPALTSSNKVSFAIEPVVAIITNQVET